MALRRCRCLSVRLRGAGRLSSCESAAPPRGPPNIADIAGCHPPMVSQEVPPVIAGDRLAFELADDVHTGPAGHRSDLGRSSRRRCPLAECGGAPADKAFGASAPPRYRSDVLYVASRNPLIQRWRQRVPQIVAVHTASPHFADDLDLLSLAELALE